MAKFRVIGADLGGTKMLFGCVNEKIEVDHVAYHLVNRSDQDAVIEDVGRCVEELMAKVPEVWAVGFGIPCTFDRERGVAVQAVNLPITNIPFAEVMQERLGLPVFVDNDANLAALAEQRIGSARGAGVVVMLTLGTGIGGGVVIDGRLFRGSNGAGAELGHMVIDVDGPRCQGACTSHGCLESMASGVTIAREARAAAEREPDSALGMHLAKGGELTGEIVTEAARAGDRAAIEVLAHAGRNLGVGVSNLVNAFNPDVVVIGGGVSDAGELLLEPAREEMRARALPPGRDTVRVVQAGLGERAGMIGAGILALDELGEE